MRCVLWGIDTASRTQRFSSRSLERTTAVVAVVGVGYLAVLVTTPWRSTGRFRRIRSCSSTREPQCLCNARVPAAQHQGRAERCQCMGPMQPVTAGCPQLHVRNCVSSGYADLPVPHFEAGPIEATGDRPLCPTPQQCYGLPCPLCGRQARGKSAIQVRRTLFLPPSEGPALRAPSSIVYECPGMALFQAPRRPRPPIEFSVCT